MPDFTKKLRGALGELSFTCAFIIVVALMVFAIGVIAVVMLSIEHPLTGAPVLILMAFGLFSYMRHG